MPFMITIRSRARGRLGTDAEFIAAFKELRAAYRGLVDEARGWTLDEEAVKSISHPAQAASRVYRQSLEWSKIHGSAGEAVPLPPTGSGPQVVDRFVCDLRAVLEAYGPLVDDRRHWPPPAAPLARVKHPNRAASRVADQVADWARAYPDPPPPLPPRRLTSGDLGPHDHLYDAGPG